MHEFVFDTDEVKFLLECLLCWEGEHGPLDPADRARYEQLTQVFKFAIE